MNTPEPTGQDGFQPLAAGPVLRDAAAGPWHRRWLVVDEDLNWLDARRAPELPGLHLQLRFGYLALRASGMLRLDVPLDVIEDDPEVECRVGVAGQSVRAVDEGDLAAAWFSQWLGQPARLVKIHPEASAVHWPA
ncbi:MOSC N-terminal beta barrel domain-containing protein [Castellaniella sp.]|uniref:MOSC N-terminal beta barrel domain-containing protein n=1 Tax=Castellaniella sp. TaxID=1955812 RepID=UPI00356076E3